MEDKGETTQDVQNPGASALGPNEIKPNNSIAATNSDQQLAQVE